MVRPMLVLVSWSWCWCLDQRRWGKAEDESELEVAEMETFMFPLEVMQMVGIKKE